MSKKDRTYSDAMNEWAAKRSFIRNRKNRIIHPSPELPGWARAFGYLFRIAVVAFLVWVVGFTVARNYYNGDSFNEKFKSGLQTFVNAKEFEASNFSWVGNKAGSKKIKAVGNDSAIYREFEAERVSFKLPLFKRIRRGWEIQTLDIEKLAIELRSGGKMHSKVGEAAGVGDDAQLVAAGLLGPPDFEDLSIGRVSCTKADFSWGLSRATNGELTGTSFELFGSSTPSWRMDLEGGLLRQNWIRDLKINSAKVRREGNEIKISDSEITLGDDTESGTIEGTVTLERLPKVDLQIKLPAAPTRSLLPPLSSSTPEYFYGTLRLSLNLTGSINTFAGVETNATAELIEGTFSKIPVLEAIDKLLKTSVFRIYSPSEGEVEFGTSDGQLKVTRFECKSRATRSILRGQFTYTPAITRREADAANAASVGGERVTPRPDNISGSLELGVPPSWIEDSELAKEYFKKEAEGKVWVTIPLEGPLKDATRKQQQEILAKLRGE